MKTWRVTKMGHATGLALLLALIATVARADWRIDAETGALYESNLSNSDRAADAKDDFAWRSDVQVSNGFQLTRDLRLNLAADLREEVWARFDDFDHVAPGGTVGLRYRFGLGRTAPWVLVEDHAAYAAFKDDGRSGRDNRFRVRGGFGISETLSVEAAYTFDDFAARDSFWDLSGHGGSIGLTFDATSSLQMRLTYSYRDGEVISYALPPRPDIVALNPVLESVNSFGNPPYTAYRLRGPTSAISASISYSLGKYTSVEVSYEFRHTSAGPLEYEDHVIETKIAFAY